MSISKVHEIVYQFHTYYYARYTNECTKGIIMTITNFIKSRLKELNMTQNDLASALGITKQNLNNKLSRDNFSSKELSEITAVLKTDIVMKNENGETVIRYDE